MLKAQGHDKRVKELFNSSPDIVALTTLKHLVALLSSGAEEEAHAAFTGW